MKKSIRGILAWEDWLKGRLSPEGIVREPEASSEDEEIWRVGFRDDTRARVHVTAEALELDGARFDATIARLESNDWIAMLEEMRPHGIRIHADGSVEEVRSDP